MKNIKQSGFTLIEVLIASMILFAVIASVSHIYRSATISSLKATRALEVTSATTLLIETISFNLKSGEYLNGEIEEGVINGFRFEWSGNIVKKGSAPSRLSADDGKLVHFDDKFYLWHVQLKLIKDDYSKSFEFEELTWGSY